MMTPLPHVPDECVRIDDYWGGWPPGRAPGQLPPSMPVENPAAVNSSVRPRSRKRACYGLSRLRTGEAAEAPHRSVRVVTIVGCGRRVARRRSWVLVPARPPNLTKSRTFTLSFTLDL